MSRLILGLPLIVFLTLISPALGHDSRAFISTSAVSPSEVASDTNPSIRMAQGVSLPLYLWWESSGDEVEAFSHDIVMSQAILTRDTRLEVPEDYIIENPSLAGELRWQAIDSGTFGGTALVNDANAFRIAGSNLGQGGTNDPTFDPISSTYRLSKFTFTGTTVGTTELRIGVGNGGMTFINHPANTPVLFGFGDASVAGDAKGSTSVDADAVVEVVAIDGTKPWQNPAQVEDVNGSLNVTPLDALLIINALNARGPFDVDDPPPADELPIFYDTSGNNNVAAQDALIVINYLNDQATLQEAAIAFPSLANAEAAVPEPASGGLAACGVGLLIAYSCRRRLRFVQEPAIVSTKSGAPTADAELCQNVGFIGALHAISSRLTEQAGAPTCK